MERNDALSLAKVNYAAHRKAIIENLFRGADLPDELLAYGYRHGWYTVGEYCFSQEDITGEAYDHDQGGWAYL